MTITNEKIAEIRSALRNKVQIAFQLEARAFRIDVQTVAALLDRLDAAEAENARLRAALEPFALFGDILGPENQDGFDILVYDPAGYPDRKLVGNHLRAARAALEAKDD